MTVNERIKHYRKKAGLTQQQLAERSGFSTASAINKIELGLRSVNEDKLKRLSEALRVSARELMFGEKESIVSIPVLGYVKAGVPADAVENIIGYEEITEEAAKNGEYFALKIKGDSMEPRFFEGDTVIVKKQPQVHNNEIAVVLIDNNEATVKKFYSDEKGVSLISLNTEYKPFYFSKEELDTMPLEILGKVVELRAKFK